MLDGREEIARFQEPSKTLIASVLSVRVVDLEATAIAPAPEEGNTLTIYYILPDFRGKPGVGVRVSLHQCRTLQEETHPKLTPLPSLGRP